MEGSPEQVARRLVVDLKKAAVQVFSRYKDAEGVTAVDVKLKSQHHDQVKLIAHVDFADGTYDEFMVTCSRKI